MEARDRSGSQGLVQVGLREEVDVEGKDGFERRTETRFRVLELVEGIYRRRVFVPKKRDTGDTASTSSGTEYVENPDLAVEPKRRGGPLDEIPFEIVDLGEAPLIDLADLNVDHYRNSASLANGLATVRDVWPIEAEDVMHARGLADELSHLGARDLLHLACVRRRGASEVKTFDRGLAAAFGR